MDDWQWQQWQRPGPTRAQQRNDIWLAAAVAGGAVVVTLLVNSMGAFIFGAAPGLAEQLAWVVALTAPLAVRRRFPAAAVLLVGALFIAAQARQVGDNLFPSIVLFLAIYSLGAWGRDRVAARWVRVGVIVAMFGWLGVSMARDLAGPPPEFADAAGPLDPLLAAALYSIGLNLLFFLAAYFFGNLAWESARRQHQLVRQGEQLRRSQAENARQAVVSERLRIARDLHDVVAHHVSVMGVQAAAARRVLRSDADLASTSLSAVEQTARTAIGELRGLVGVLRTEPIGAAGAGASRPAPPAGSDQAAPGLDQLSGLVEEVQATGLRVRHTVFGDPRPVPAAVGLSAYRVVQEAFTNTVKHAAASNAEVRVRFLERTLEVEVSDDGRGRPDPRPGAGPGSGLGGGLGGDLGGGLGLVGMRERVAVHGGELDVGPRREGGFQVRARFPLTGGARENADGAATDSAATDSAAGDSAATDSAAGDVAAPR